MAIPSPWPVTNLTMYSTPLTCAMILSIGDSVELVELGLLAKFYTQLVCLVAWQVPKSHQGTCHRSYHNVFFNGTSGFGIWKV